MRRTAVALRRVAAALGAAVVALALVVALAVWATLAPGDPALYPPRGPERVAVAVLDHGWHTGLVLSRDDLEAAAARLASGAPEAAERLRWLAGHQPVRGWIEVGWGDAEFYRVTPGVTDIDPWLALRAIAWPTASVLQVVPGQGAVAAAFPGSGRVGLALSPEGFDRLAAALAASVPPAGARPALGPSLYGWGAFYPAVPSYHLFRTCNHWTSALLRAAGVPSSALPATFSAGLLAELRWRAP